MADAESGHLQSLFFGFSSLNLFLQLRHIGLFLLGFFLLPADCTQNLSIFFLYATDQIDYVTFAFPPDHVTVEVVLQVGLL